MMVDFHDFGISQQLRTETQMMFSPAPLFCFFFADSPERRTDVWREGLPPSKTKHHATWCMQYHVT